jgi:hypothetical protein
MESWTLGLRNLLQSYQEPRQNLSSPNLPRKTPKCRNLRGSRKKSASCKRQRNKIRSKIIIIRPRIQLWLRKQMRGGHLARNLIVHSILQGPYKWGSPSTTTQSFKRDTERTRSYIRRQSHKRRPDNPKKVKWLRKLSVSSALSQRVESHKQRGVKAEFIFKELFMGLFHHLFLQWHHHWSIRTLIRCIHLSSMMRLSST